MIYQSKTWQKSILFNASSGALLPCTHIRPGCPVSEAMIDRLVILVEAAVCRWLPIQGQYFEGRHKGNWDDCFVIYLKRYNNITILTFSSSFVPIWLNWLSNCYQASYFPTSLFQMLSFFRLFILGFKRLFNLHILSPMAYKLYHIQFILHYLVCTILLLCTCYEVLCSVFLCPIAGGERHPSFSTWRGGQPWKSPNKLCHWQ